MIQRLGLLVRSYQEDALSGKESCNFDCLFFVGVTVEEEDVQIWLPFGGSFLLFAPPCGWYITAVNSLQNLLFFRITIYFKFFFAVRSHILAFSAILWATQAVPTRPCGPLKIYIHKNQFASDQNADYNRLKATKLNIFLVRTNHFEIFLAKYLMLKCFFKKL